MSSVQVAVLEFCRFGLVTRLKSNTFCGTFVIFRPFNCTSAGVFHGAMAFIFLTGKSAVCFQISISEKWNPC